MALIVVNAICSGTETRKSRSTGKDYFITKFVELPSMKPFEVFGDLGIAPNLTPREYRFNADIVKLQNVSIAAGASASKSQGKE